MRKIFLFAALATATLSMAHDDGAQILRFGPFLQQGFTLEGSPAGYRYLPPSGSYNFQAGWMEPISILPKALFRGTYLETQGNATLSPYQADIGVVFNLRPIRFLEGGLGYNRLLFPNTLIGFHGDSLPGLASWRTKEILGTGNREIAGADVFTFHVNATMNAGWFELRAGGFRSLWDVQVSDRDIFLEYHSGFLMKKRDRINSMYAQAMFNLEPYFQWEGFTARGLAIRDQYWWTTRTGLSQNLVSAGLTGFRRGHNDDRSYHGLDGLIGFWTDNPQLNGQDWWKHFYLSLQWTWNIQILHLGEN
jgi:hypothetical protein